MNSLKPLIQLCLVQDDILSVEQQKMNRVMQYAYFKIYQYLQKVKTNDDPAFNALLILGLTHVINVGTLFSILSEYQSITITDGEANSNALVVAGTVFVLDYLLLYRRKGSIIEKYKNEVEEKGKRGEFFVFHEFNN